MNARSVHAPFSSKGLPACCWLTRQTHWPPAWHPSWTVLPWESVAWHPHSVPSVPHAGLPHEPRGPCAGGGVPVPVSMKYPPPESRTEGGLPASTGTGGAPASTAPPLLEPPLLLDGGVEGAELPASAAGAVSLGPPATVELIQLTGPSPIAYPTSARVEYHFPARGALPPVTLNWREGGLKPAKPPQMEANRELAQGGQLIVGSKATVYDGNDYCNSPRIVPESLHRELAPTFPPKTIPRVPQGNPHKEWTSAIRAGNPHGAGSNFEYSVPYTETVCLGTVAILVGGKINWDPTAMTTGRPEADKLIYPHYRRGWAPEKLPA